MVDLERIVVVVIGAVVGAEQASSCEGCADMVVVDHDQVPWTKWLGWVPRGMVLGLGGKIGVGQCGDLMDTS